MCAKVEDEPSSSFEKRNGFYRVGTVGRVLNLTRVKDKSNKAAFSMLVEGLARARIDDVMTANPFYRVRARTIPAVDDDAADAEVKAISINIRKAVHELLTLVQKHAAPLSTEMRGILESITKTKIGHLADLITANVEATVAEKQAVLSDKSLLNRLKKAYDLIMRNVEVLRMSSKMQQETETKLKNAGREYFLRQQMKAIQRELDGIRSSSPSAKDSNAPKSEIEVIVEKLESASLSEEAQAIADRELTRLKGMQPSMPEYSSLSNYLTWLADLPWDVKTEDNLDMAHARDSLEKGHHGLEKVKKRILEFLAVRAVKAQKGVEGDSRGPLLCLCGPPGVGKTSLGMGVAKALGRKFHRIALGGMRDEAEIRGHRRTYIGSMPGRLVQALKKVGCKNPVILLDEIDKLGRDVRGDPGSALLEVLDPEQNGTFTDHYLNVAFDLSEVLFIATANRLDTIPSPLLDRMELIDIHGYTPNEKIEIAMRHLVPKQIDRHGLMEGRDVAFQREGVAAIAQGYTREAGVRGLEKKIAAVCRSIAVSVADAGPGGKIDAVTVVPEVVYETLGPRIFESSADEIASRVGGTPGVATGLAWTRVGGEVLFVEAAVMRGNGKLVLTGKLGQVMSESVQAAMSYVRSNVRQLGLAALAKAHKVKDVEMALRSMDVHCHFPQGAVSKDGPSAGVAITAAIYSALTGRSLRPDTCTTGEITIQGLVLPVGGIKEKLIAGHQAGLARAVIPARNKKDLRDVPQEVLDSMEIVLASNVMDALENLVEGGMSAHLVSVNLSIPRWLSSIGSAERMTTQPAGEDDYAGPILESSKL